jgi:hypothetical protein
MDEVLEDWHGAHAGGPGDTGSGEPGLVPGILDRLNALPPPASLRTRARPLALLAIAACAVVLLGVGLWRGHVWNQELSALRQELVARPGFILLAIDSPGRGVATIEGLLDLDAEDPRKTVRKLHPEPRLTWRLRPFVSGEPSIAASRLARALRLPKAAVRVDQAGVARLTGQVPFDAWYAARHPPTITGITRVDASSLSFPGQRRYDRMLAEVNAMRFGFIKDLEPQPAAHFQIQEMIKLLERLQAMAKRDRIAVALYVSGYNDEPGGPSLNRDLRFSRAEWLASQLSGNLHTPNRLLLNSDVLTRFGFHGDGRAATVRAVLEPRRD